MRVIASANQKGGCGKTTTAINLSSSLARRNHRVLLIDFDPQAHATMGLNIKPAELERSMYNVISPSVNPVSRIEDVLLSIGENFDLAPSNAKLTALEQELAGVDGRESRLRYAVELLKNPYDYIIIDCPPSIGHLCFNALRACEEVIIPIDLSLFSLRGVSKLMELVVMLKEKLDHNIQCRALITMYDLRTRYSKHVMEKVKEEFGENVFNTVIRYNIRLRETVDHGLPIGEYDKRAIGHRDYEDLADEVLGSHAVDELGTAQKFLKKTEDYTSQAEMGESAMTL
jgi:chromosome partitioning protein